MGRRNSSSNNEGNFWMRVVLFSLLSPLAFLPMLYIEVLISTFLEPSGYTSRLTGFERIISIFSSTAFNTRYRFVWLYLVLAYVKYYISIPTIFVLNLAGQKLLTMIPLNRYLYYVVSLIFSGLAFYAFVSIYV